MAKIGFREDTSANNSVVDGGRQRKSLFGSFRNSVDKWKQSQMDKQDDSRQSDPRYRASELATKDSPTREPYEAEVNAQIESIKSSPYLDEFMKARNLAKSQFGTAEKEGDIALRRTLAAQGGTSGGQAIRLQQEGRAGLEREKAQTLGQLDVAEAQERTRRQERAQDLGIQKFEFDKTMGFQEQSLGFQVMQNYEQIDLTRREDIFNSIIALEEGDVSAGDIDNMRSIFESVWGTEVRLPSTKHQATGVGTTISSF